MAEKTEARIGDWCQVFPSRVWRQKMEQGYRLTEIKKAEAFSGSTVCVIDALGWVPTRGHVLRCFVLGSGEIVDFERGCLDPQQQPRVSPRAEEKTP